MRLIIFLPWTFVFTAQLATKRQPFQTGVWFGRETWMGDATEGRGICLTFGEGRFVGTKWVYKRWVPTFHTTWRNSAMDERGHA